MWSDRNPWRVKFRHRFLLAPSLKACTCPFRDFLEEINTLLEDKKQVIFQGPPGTGKTYVARKSASREHLCRLQRPRYSCAVPPVLRITWTLCRATVPLLCKRSARFQWTPRRSRTAIDKCKRPTTPQGRNPGAKHFLIIDEINRGNSWPKSSASCTSCWNTETNISNLQYTRG